MFSEGHPRPSENRAGPRYPIADRRCRTGREREPQAGDGPQGCGGTEAGQDHRGVDAAEKPGHCTDTQNTEHQPPIAQIMDLYRKAQHAVEQGHQDFRQRQREDQRDHGGHQGFAQELDDQLPPPRAHHLAQPDLARPHHRARRRQVGEIETGDQ